MIVFLNKSGFNDQICCTGLQALSTQEFSLQEIFSYFLFLLTYTFKGLLPSINFFNALLLTEIDWKPKNCVLLLFN